MIRDPSDGSVRPPLNEELIKAVTREAKKPKGPALDHEPTRKFVAGEYDTGIRQPVRTDAQERLERSREWLKNYHAKRGVSHADGGANTEANGGVRASSQGLEQQGDSPEAQRQSADRRGSSG